MNASHPSVEDEHVDFVGFLKLLKSLDRMEVEFLKYYLKRVL
jgi:hypothetical protein